MMANCHADELCCILQLQFTHQIDVMNTDSFRADSQLFRNLCTGVSFCYQFEYLKFPVGKPIYRLRNRSRANYFQVDEL